MFLSLPSQAVFEKTCNRSRSSWIFTSSPAFLSSHLLGKVYKFFSQWIFGGFILKTPLVIVLLPEEEEVYERKHIVSWNNTLGTILNVWFLKTTMPKGDSKGKGSRGKRGQQPRKKGDCATLGFVFGVCFLYWFIKYFQLKLWIGS